MRIRITSANIFGANGPIPVGTEFDVKEAPKGWAGRYDVIPDRAKAATVAAAPAGKTAVTNPATGSIPGDRKALLRATAAKLAADRFTADGKPDVRAINEALAEGETAFTAEERDALWAEG